MTVDARIPLGIRRRPSRDTKDAYTRMTERRRLEEETKIRQMRMRNLTAQDRKLQQENEQLEREARGLQVFNDLMRENLKFNDDGTVKTKPAAIKAGLIKAGFPDLAQQYEKSRVEAKERLARASLADLELDRKQNVMIGGMAGQVLANPETYPSVLKQAKQSGLDVSGFPPEYSDELRPKLLGSLYSSLSGKELVDLFIKQKDPERVQEWYGLVSQTMAPIKNQGRWTSHRSFLKAKGVPEGIMQLVPEQYSPEAAQRVAQLGLTPEQQQSDRIATSQNEALVEAVMANPEIYHDLTPSARTTITPELSRMGFTGFREDTRKQDEEKSAESGYEYQQRISKHNRDFETEINELQKRVGIRDEFSGDIVANISRATMDRYKLEAKKIHKRHADLLEAALREHLAKSGSGSPPTYTPKRGSSPQEEKVPLWDPFTGEFK